MLRVREEKKESVCTVRVYRGMPIDRVVLTVRPEPNCDQVVPLRPLSLRMLRESDRKALDVCETHNGDTA